DDAAGAVLEERGADRRGVVHGPLRRRPPQRRCGPRTSGPAMTRIAIVIGSTRPGRKAEVVAQWVHAHAARRGDATFELVDIADYDLPLLDEPFPPTMGK